MSWKWTVRSRLDRIEKLLETIGEQMSIDFAKLTSSVANITNVVTGAETVISALFVADLDATATGLATAVVAVPPIPTPTPTTPPTTPTP